MVSEYGTSDFRKGIRIELDGQPYVVIDSEFMKPGKGQAVYRLKLKHLIQGNVIDRTYRSGDKIPAADVEVKPMQYMYNDSREWHFMDPETFEQHAVAREVVGDGVQWMKEEASCEVTLWNERVVSVSVPSHVLLKVTYCEPGVRGDTATNVRKPAKVETDAEVMVPIFIKEGDTIKIDTRTGEYLERVQQKG